MVDVNTLNLLDPAAGWDDVVQLENGWKPTGGPVDLANDGGIFNAAPQALAARTKYLLAALGGIGGVANTTANLNTHVKTGLFSYTAGAPGNPSAGSAGAVLHVEESANVARQIAVSATGVVYTRSRANNAPSWGAWNNFITDKGGSIAGGNLDFDISGYQIQFLGDNIQRQAMNFGGTGHQEWSISYDDGTGDLAIKKETYNDIHPDRKLRIAGFEASVGAAGYQRFPSGWILQTGKSLGIGTNGNSQTVTFPLAFPTTCVTVTASAKLGVNTAYTVTIKTLSAASFSFFTDATSGEVVWQAFGY